MRTSGSASRSASGASGRSPGALVERRVCTPELAFPDAGSSTADVLRRLEGAIKQMPGVAASPTLGTLRNFVTRCQLRRVPDTTSKEPARRPHNDRRRGHHRRHPRARETPVHERAVRSTITTVPNPDHAHHAHHALPTRPEGQTGFKLLGDMGDIADDINEVFSLQSSVYKAIGEPHTSSASNPAGSRAPDTPQRPMP